MPRPAFERRLRILLENPMNGPHYIGSTFTRNISTSVSRPAMANCWKKDDCHPSVPLCAPGQGRNAIPGTAAWKRLCSVLDIRHSAALRRQAGDGPSRHAESHRLCQKAAAMPIID